MDGSVSYKPSECWAKDWHKAHDYIVKALERSPGHETLEDIFVALTDGRAQLWVGERSAAVTVCIGKTFTLWLAGGKLGELKDMLPAAEEVARDFGAEQIQVFGRRGWEHSFLEPAGYKPRWTILEKSLWAG